MIHRTFFGAKHFQIVNVVESTDGGGWGWGVALRHYTTARCICLFCLIAQHLLRPHGGLLIPTPDYADVRSTMMTSLRHCQAGGSERGTISEYANEGAVATSTLSGSSAERAVVGQRIQGFACSPGRVRGAADDDDDGQGGSAPGVTGPCRVITSLADQARDVRAGEILVAEYTSPAWTPLFSLVVGIVLEHGGMLSHGAVVARECGIPASDTANQSAPRLSRSPLPLSRELRVEGRTKHTMRVLARSLSPTLLSHTHTYIHTHTHPLFLARSLLGILNCMLTDAQ